MMDEGYLLPTLLSICIALVAEMYTTTALQKEEPVGFQSTGRRRVRLTHKTSPIADFGIVKGSTRVIDSDKLAYHLTETNEVMYGRDPNDHYRIYFKTLAGHKYFLDLGMYTFNFNLGVESSFYSALYNEPLGLPQNQGPEMVSALYTDTAPDISTLDQLQFKPRERFSVLRDPKIQSIIEPLFSDPQATGFTCDESLAFKMMDKIAGRRCWEDEKIAMLSILDKALRVFRINLVNRDYLNFPKTPRITIDCSESDEGVGEASQDYSSFVHAECKKLKKGKISTEKCREELKEMHDREALKAKKSKD